MNKKKSSKIVDLENKVKPILLSTLTSKLTSSLYIHQGVYCMFEKNLIFS